MIYFHYYFDENINTIKVFSIGNKFFLDFLFRVSFEMSYKSNII